MKENTGMIPGIRPGNIVTFGGSEVCTVTEVSGNSHYYAENHEGESYKSTWADLRPMKPTPFVMSRLMDFTESGNGIFRRDWLTLHYRPKTGVFDFIFKVPDSDFTHASSFIYVHELQNMWLAITRTEITYSKM